MLMWFVYWYLAGLIPSIVVSVFDWYNGRDTSYSDLIEMALYCLGGPIFGMVLMKDISSKLKHKTAIRGRKK